MTAELWDQRHRATPATELSWFQATPTISLELIDQLASAPHRGVIDIGGGISPLAAALVDSGFDDVTVLDISDAALHQAANRLADPTAVRWVLADIRTWTPPRTWGIWHDRAVFHFLTDRDDRDAYLEVLTRAVEPGGGIIIGTFAHDGPEQCSGLPIERYDAAELLETIASHVDIVEVTSRRDVHITPGGAEQAYTWIACRRT